MKQSILILFLALILSVYGCSRVKKAADVLVNGDDNSADKVNKKGK